MYIMSTITAIVMQQKNKKRVNLSVDGKFFCGLEAITVLKHNLQVGQEVETDELEELVLESEKNTAFDRAIGYLSIRRRAVSEMQHYLSEKGYLPTTIEYVISKLLEYGYLDDDAFAKVYIESKCNKDGKRKLEYELKHLGIAPEIVSKYLNTIDTAQVLQDLIAKKYKNDSKKIMDHCLSRGFEYENVKRALDNFLLDLGE